MTNLKQDLQSDNAGGFTLLELLAALFILTVGLFGVIQMHHVGLGKLRVLNESIVASHAVQNEIEHLRALPFAALQNVQNGPFHSKSPEPARLVNAKPAVTIEDFRGTPRLKKVTASLAWTGEYGRTIRKSVTTLIADKGIPAKRTGT